MPKIPDWDEDEIDNQRDRWTRPKRQTKPQDDYNDDRYWDRKRQHQNKRNKKNPYR